MPSGYSALQDVEARQSIDESEISEVYQDVKNRPKMLDVASGCKISIVKKLALLSLFAGYTALVLGLGHALKKSNSSYIEPSAALLYLQGKIIVIWHEWKLIDLQKNTSSPFHGRTISPSHSMELWTIHQISEVHHHQTSIAHGLVPSTVSIKQRHSGYLE